jgi:hypothetical protein
MTKQQHFPRMTAGELGHLWEQYMNNSLVSVILGYLLKKIDEEEIRNICSFALMVVQTDLNRMTKLYEQEDFPLPEGFTERDMNPNAPKPVTDEFVLFVLQDMSQLDLALTAVSLADAVRKDLRELYRERLAKAAELHEKATSLLLEKGLFVRSPHVNSTHEYNPVAEQSFMSNWFGNEPRMLTAREAHELHKNVLLNYHGKCWLMVLHQTNQNEKMQRLLLRGKELSSNIMKKLSDVLIENDLPVAMTWDTHILDTQESPFSDKLICFLLDQLNKFGVASYGYAAAVSARKDLKAMYAGIIVDVYQYEADLKNFMIENHWLERPPLALDRRNLSKT